MKPPKVFGKIIYFCGYPVFRLLIKGTTRAYVVVRVKDELLVTQNWLGFQKKWRLPGGGVHDGEAPVHAVQRELAEEVGVRTNEQNLQLLGEFTSEFNYQYSLFELTLPEKPELTVDEREILRAQFMPLADIANVYVSEEIRNFLKLVKKDPI